MRRTTLATLEPRLAQTRIILWKFVLIAFVRVDTEGAKFKPQDIWVCALRRFEARNRRLDIYVSRITLRRRCAGLDPPRYDRYTAALAPIASYDENGCSEPHPKLIEALQPFIHLLYPLTR